MKVKFKENHSSVASVALKNPNCSTTKFNTSDEKNYDSADMLLTSDMQMNGISILNSTYSFHMSHNENLFLDYQVIMVERC